MKRSQHHRRKTLEQLPMAAGLAVLAGLLAQTPGAQAQPKPIPGGYLFSFNKNISTETPPPTPPAGDGPWLSAAVTDNGTGGVYIDLTGALISPLEFISSVGFNLAKRVSPSNGALDSSLWSCTAAPIDSINCGASSIEQQFDALPKINMANGAQGFDLAINLPISNKDKTGRFQLGDTARFSIAGLSPDDFRETNDPGSPITGLYSAAKVQGIGPKGEGSATIGDPPSDAPGPLPLLGAGVALGFSRRLRQRMAGAGGHRSD